MRELHAVAAAMAGDAIPAAFMEPAINQPTCIPGICSRSNAGTVGAAADGMIGLGAAPALAVAEPVVPVPARAPS